MIICYDFKVTYKNIFLDYTIGELKVIFIKRSINSGILFSWRDGQYKYLWGMKSKGRGLNLYEGSSYTYTLRLG